MVIRFVIIGFCFLWIAALAQTVRAASLESIMQQEPVVDMNILEGDDFSTAPTPQQSSGEKLGHMRVESPILQISNSLNPFDLPTSLTMDQYQQYLAEHPDDIKAWSAYGKLLFLKQNIPGSIRAYTRAYFLNTNSLAALNNYAAIMVAAGNYQESQRILLDAVVRYPRVQHFRYNLACLYSLTDHPQDAIKELKRIEAARWHLLPLNLTDPDLDPLRKRSDFQALEKRVQRW